MPDLRSSRLIFVGGHTENVYVEIETFAVLGLDANEHPRFTYSARVYPRHGTRAICDAILDAYACDSNRCIDVYLVDDDNQHRRLGGGFKKDSSR